MRIRGCLLLTGAAACGIAEAPEPSLEPAVALAVEAMMEVAAAEVDALDSTDFPREVSAQGVGERTGLPVIEVSYDCSSTMRCWVEPQVDVFFRVPQIRVAHQDSVTVEVLLHDFRDHFIINGYGVDLVRSPDGEWRVVDTRLETES